MYHYVRDLQHSHHPKLKALDVKLFERQIRYLKKKFSIVKMEEVIDAIIKQNALPENAALLTFDDGYSDHFNHVFPLLRDQDIQGSFFPSGKATKENCVLDVNKIQFTLASAPENEILQTLLEHIETYRKDHALASKEEYWKKYAIANRFDTAEVVFIKSMLQKGLDAPLRKKIADALFKKYVSKKEEQFAKELYLSASQIKLMKKEGMFIGSHGYEHCWLGTLSEEQQKEEIKKSLQFLEELGCSENWVMCYPYGSQNASLIRLLASSGCRAGLTVELGVADLKFNNPFRLPRIDTTDVLKEMAGFQAANIYK
ncbi:polysaccharide deacetylase [Candidatus Woesearchaeota archaeon]|nr:MAG: polysaccharide deacetylase [Candidatus Woesearchaeota archaeon]